MSFGRVKKIQVRVPVEARKAFVFCQVSHIEFFMAMRDAPFVAYYIIFTSYHIKLCCQVIFTPMTSNFPMFTEMSVSNRINYKQSKAPTVCKLYLFTLYAREILQYYKIFAKIVAWHSMNKNQYSTRKKPPTFHSPSACAQGCCRNLSGSVT